MRMQVVRREYLPDRTIGQLSIDGQFFCWTLEDRVRPPGEKVYGQTAIPEGTYRVTLEPFRGDKDKMYPYLHDVPMFTGVCMHGGNTPEDTLGCILIGFHRDDGTIHGSAVANLSDKISKQSEEVTIEVKNGY